MAAAEKWKQKANVARAAEVSMRSTYIAQQHKLNKTEHGEEINGGYGRRAWHHQRLDELIAE